MANTIGQSATAARDLSLSREPLLGNRFLVTFFAGGIAPNPLDIRFQKVSGLSVEVKTTALNEGGQNLYSHQLPDRVDHGNLILERGLVVGSPLNAEFNAVLSTFKFVPSNVLVALLNAEGAPVAGWMFIKAFPVKLSTADLSAGEAAVVIDSMELAYSRMQILRI
jgi:phage tail-like protein